MGNRRLAGALLAVCLAAACTGAPPAARAGGAAPPAAQTTPAEPSAQPVSRPLRPQQGTPGWQLSDAGPQHAVEGFTDRTDVLPGTAVRLYVSTTAPTYTVTAYRIGPYVGSDAREVWRSSPQPGRQQAPAAELAATRTPYAPWRPSMTVRTNGWRPGDYLLRLDASSGAQRFVPLTVRSPSTRGRVVLLNAVTTWQAYNTWGGRSLYHGPDGGFATRARAVSFDRPYANGGGAGDFLGNELPLVVFAQRLGIPLAYETDLDLHRDPGLLDGARAVISPGHDEYYSAAMRQALMSARAGGTNIAFLGANAVYRHIRLAATDLGPDRLEICYKVYGEDPARHTDPAQVTVQWRDPPDPRPESVLTGTFYQCNPVHADMVVADPKSWLLAGLGLQAGDRLSGLVGSEYDRVDPSVPTPRPIDVLFHSPVTCHGTSSYADAAYYVAPSGAGVFDSGTSSWECALQVTTCADGRGDLRAQRIVRAVTARLLLAFAAGPAGRTGLS